MGGHVAAPRPIPGRAATPELAAGLGVPQLPGHPLATPVPRGPLLTVNKIFIVDGLMPPPPPHPALRWTQALFFIIINNNN